MTSVRKNPEIGHALTFRRKPVIEASWIGTTVSWMALYFWGMNIGMANGPASLFWNSLLGSVLLWFVSLVLASFSRKSLKTLFYIVTLLLGFICAAVFIGIAIFAAVASCPEC
jgi:hypothetical protein